MSVGRAHVVRRARFDLASEDEQCNTLNTCTQTCTASGQRVRPDCSAELSTRVHCFAARS